MIPMNNDRKNNFAMLACAWWRASAISPHMG
uniref:Uncharacterized protein n=1 Tax=Anguilla anguilla TaxID=7936 RepID=A0A0E9UAA2_ANGAN